LRRHRRVRKKVTGTPDRPRLVVFRSLRHIYGQLVDDVAGVTLAAVGSDSRLIRNEVGEGGGKTASSRAVGKALAEKALALGHRRVVFDRGGYLYHGRVQALAESAREAGLEF
jgi:large subunit ribosomal protein L18